MGRLIVSAINPLVALYDFHGMEESGAILLFSPGHHIFVIITYIRHLQL
jgi:hypothetical protein